jgi:hypothetical protein
MRRDSGLLRPIPLIAIAVLVINDHLLKDAYPSWLTGKLSDVAGLVFFPLLACALLAPLVRIDRDRLLTACVVATGIGFSLIKLWEPATALCEHVLGALQLSPGPVDIVRDPTDLLALPALAYAVAQMRADTGPGRTFGAQETAS